jgi:hypothetical protein
MRIMKNLPLGINFIFHETDFVLREVIEVVNEVVDPAVGGVDLAPEVGLFVFRPGDGQPPVQSEFYPSLKNS